MYRHPHSEFALGEFAGFEFAHETGTAVASASFFIEAGASAQFSAQPFALGAFAVATASTAQFGGSKIVKAAFQLAGMSQFLALGQACATTTATAKGTSQSTWEAGRLVRPTFAIEGVAKARWYSYGSVGYEIEGKSTVVAPTEVTANLRFNLRGTSQFNALVEGYFETTMTSASKTTVTMRAAPFGMGAFDIAGTSDMQTDAMKVQAAGFDIEGRATATLRLVAPSNTRFTTAGHGQLTAPALAVRHLATRFASEGRADTHIETNSRQRIHTDFDLFGTSAVDMRSQVHFNAEMHPHGYATVAWVRGPQVLRYIDPAVDLVERPEELRGVERPEENRLAEVA